MIFNFTFLLMPEFLIGVIDNSQCFDDSLRPECSVPVAEQTRNYPAVANLSKIMCYASLDHQDRHIFHPVPIASCSHQLDYGTGTT